MSAVDTTETQMCAYFLKREVQETALFSFTVHMTYDERFYYFFGKDSIGWVP